jgi:hypothetical protein
MPVSHNIPTCSIYPHTCPSIHTHTCSINPHVLHIVYPHVFNRSPRAPYPVPVSPRVQYITTFPIYPHVFYSTVYIPTCPTVYYIPTCSTVYIPTCPTVYIPTCSIYCIPTCSIYPHVFDISPRVQRAEYRMYSTYMYCNNPHVLNYFPFPLYSLL